MKHRRWQEILCFLEIKVQRVKWIWLRQTPPPGTFRCFPWNWAICMQSVGLIRVILDHSGWKMLQRATSPTNVILRKRVIFPPCFLLKVIIYFLKNKQIIDPYFIMGGRSCLYKKNDNFLSNSLSFHKLSQTVGKTIKFSWITFLCFQIPWATFHLFPLYYHIELSPPQLFTDFLDHAGRNGKILEYM